MNIAAGMKWTKVRNEIFGSNIEILLAKKEDFH